MNKNEMDVMETLGAAVKVDKEDVVLELIQQYQEEERSAVIKCISYLIENYNEKYFDRYIEILKNPKYIIPVTKLVIENFKKGIHNLAELLEYYQNKEGLEAIIDLATNEEHGLHFVSLLFSKDKVSKLFEIYEDQKEIAHAIRSMCLLRTVEEVWGDCGIFANEKVRELIHKKGTAMHIAKIQYKLRKNEETIEVAEIVLKYNKELLQTLAEQKSNPYDVALVYDKYFEKFPGITIFMEKFENEVLDYKELLTDVAFDVIKKSPNQYTKIEEILRSDYTKYRDNIQYEKSKLQYKDMDLIKNTLDFVLNIHSHRGKFIKEKIEEGFYEELNRAMRQSNSIEGARKMLKQYCNEVNNQMKDNISDLMVMHDA